MHGFGVYQFGNGHRYEGTWHEGRRQGLGMYTFRNGETQAGHWEDSCPSEQTTRHGSSFSISHSKVLATVQQARKAAGKAHEVVKVEEMVANRAANAARVAATKAVQTQTYYSSGGDDPFVSSVSKAFDIVTVMNLTSNYFGDMREKRERDV